MYETTTLYDQLKHRQLELNSRVESLKKDAARKASADWSEQAQERENDEVIDALGNSALVELHKIHQALDRMEHGEYGICSDCGENIPEARLQVMPYALQCVTCASKK